MEQEDIEDMEEDFNRLSMLSDEVLLDICEKMDIQTLGKFTQTNKNTYRVCQEILTERLEQEEKEDIEDFYNGTFLSQEWYNPRVGDIASINGIERADEYIGKVELEFKTVDPAILDLESSNMYLTLEDIPLKSYPKLYRYLKSLGYVPRRLL